jgi:hypothetical protein
MDEQSNLMEFATVYFKGSWTIAAASVFVSGS